MKDVLVILLTMAVLGFYSCLGSDEKPSDSDQLQDSYDAQLAQDLGADEYGMKKYVFAFLKAGPNRDQDSATASEIQTAHMNNIGKMAEEGKLVLAGPFFGDGEYQGIYVFNVESIEEAEALTNTDPAVKAGRLIMELHPWYGSAALMQVNEIHGKLSKNPL